MKTQKLIIRIVYCLAGVLFLVSIGFNIFQYKQFRELSKKPVYVNVDKNGSIVDSNTASNTASLKFTKNTMMKSTSNEGKTENSSGGETDELTYHLNAAKEELDYTNNQLSEELSKKAEFKKAWTQTSRTQSDPVYEKIRKDSSTKMVNGNYDPLFKKLDISKDMFNELKAMLVDKDIEINGLSETYLNASTKEEKEKVTQQLTDINEKYANKISDFLGTKNNEVYQAYEERLPERRDLTNFIGSLPPDNRINETRMDELIDSMYEARKAINTENAATKNEDSYTEITEELISQSMERVKRVNERYVELSRGFMTPEQVEQYNAYLKQQLEVGEAALKMSLYLNEKKQ
jgi:hypothetical protein